MLVERAVARLVLIRLIRGRTVPPFQVAISVLYEVLPGGLHSRTCLSAFEQEFRA